MDKEFELLREYLNWFIDRLYPVTIDTKIEIYSKEGYIEEGQSPQYLGNFKNWKKIKYENS